MHVFAMLWTCCALNQVNFLFLADLSKVTNKLPCPETRTSTISAETDVVKVSPLFLNSRFSSWIYFLWKGTALHQSWDGHFDDRTTAFCFNAHQCSRTSSQPSVMIQPMFRCENKSFAQLTLISWSKVVIVMIYDGMSCSFCDLTHI